MTKQLKLKDNNAISINNTLPQQTIKAKYFGYAFGSKISLSLVCLKNKWIKN